jgi:hypothetical protein
MAGISGSLEKIQSLVHSAVADNKKWSEKGNNAASIRVRAALADIMHECKAARAEVQEIKSKE